MQVRVVQRLICCAFASLRLAVKYHKALGISRAEIPRYYAKSFNLAICYGGFSPDSSRKRFQRLGSAAFICAAYDVVTDWREFSPNYLATLNAIMDGCQLLESSKAIALRLYQDEINGTVAGDGLERGELALLFISEVANLESMLKAPEKLKALGWFSQTVDDILDYEEDLARSEQNCLTSPNRLQYLEEALVYPWQDVRRELPYSLVLDKAVKKALLKGAELLALWQLPPVAADAKRGPDHKIEDES